MFLVWDNTSSTRVVSGQEASDRHRERGTGEGRGERGGLQQTRQSGLRWQVGVEGEEPHVWVG